MVGLLRRVRRSLSVVMLSMQTACVHVPCVCVHVQVGLRACACVCVRALCIVSTYMLCLVASHRLIISGCLCFDLSLSGRVCVCVCIVLYCMRVCMYRLVCACVCTGFLKQEQVQREQKLSTSSPEALSLTQSAGNLVLNMSVSSSSILTHAKSAKAVSSTTSPQSRRAKRSSRLITRTNSKRASGRYRSQCMCTCVCVCVCVCGRNRNVFLIHWITPLMHMRISLMH
jgi:hypothetical protein